MAKNHKQRKIGELRTEILRELTVAPAFAEELSIILRVDIDSIRYQLNKLRKEQLICGRPFYESDKGRPRHLYMIPAHAPKGSTMCQLLAMNSMIPEHAPKGRD